MAKRGTQAQAEFEELLEEMLVDAYGEDEQLWAMREVISDELAPPTDAFVIGEPVSLLEVDYNGNEHRGLTARCKHRDGSEHVVSLADVQMVSSADGASHLAAYRLWLGMEPASAFFDRATKSLRRHAATTDDIDVSRPIELIVLKTLKNGARCRLLGGDRGITIRTGSLWGVVPGSIITLQPKKYWVYGKTAYLSGRVERDRIDVSALGLEPLALVEEGMWDPNEEYWGEDDGPIEEWATSIIAHGQRPAFELEQIIPGAAPDDFDSDPIIEANELKDAGDAAGAIDVLSKLLEADLRCLDAHAHLGNMLFRSSPEWASRHYEVGIRIGELSFGESFDGVLPWGHVNNRPFLRCMHGFGLCLWRAGRTDEATAHFERMLWLNPTDNQGIRFLLASVRAGDDWTWEDR